MPVVTRRASAGPRGRVLDQDPGGGSRARAAPRRCCSSSRPRSPIVPPPDRAGSAGRGDAPARRGPRSCASAPSTSNLDAGRRRRQPTRRPASLSPPARRSPSASRQGPGRIAVPSLLWRSRDGGSRERSQGRASSRGCSRCPRRSLPAPSWRRARSPAPSSTAARASASTSRPARPTRRRSDANGRRAETSSAAALAAAQDRLEARGLVVRVEYALAADAPVGQVLKQDPPAATTVRRGTNVRITVSAGPEPSDLLEVIELVGLLRGRRDLGDRDRGLRASRAAGANAGSRGGRRRRSAGAGGSPAGAAGQARSRSTSARPRAEQDVERSGKPLLSWRPFLERRRLSCRRLRAPPCCCS